MGQSVPLVTCLDIELMYQAKLKEFDFLSKGSTRLLLSQISGKSLAEQEKQRMLEKKGEKDPNDKRTPAERDEDRRLEERGAVLKADLERRMFMANMNDIDQDLEFRRAGPTMDEQALKPYDTIPPFIAQHIVGLINDKKNLPLNAFPVFWNQLLEDDTIQRLELTAKLRE